MLKTKSTVFIAIYVLLLLTCISETYAQNNQFRTILVGGDDSYPPYEYFDEQGYPAGFNIDIIQAVAKVMGLRLDLKLGPWNKVRQDLEHGRLDALSGMYYSDDRDRLVDFSTPHILVSYAIFVRKNSNIKGIEDLPNQHIIVQKGDMGDDYITKTKMGSQIVRVENPAIALRLLAKGRQDCAILPRLLGLHLIDQFTLENIETAGSPFLNRKYCFAVRQGDENLLGLLNEGLVIIRKTGIYDQIYSKWFGAYEKRNARAEIINYLIWVLVPVVALLGLVFGWAWSLRRTVASKTRKLVDELAERKRAEEALKESESRHRTLVDTIPDLIWLKDQNGVYISCNPTFERFFGAKESEIVGKTDYDFVDKDLADFFREHDQKAMQAGRPSINEEWLTFADNGYYGLFETIKIPMRDTNGNLMGVLGIARDITERHKSEKEKISLKSQLSQIQKMESLGTLAGGIAHDFNNILASIIGYTELSLDIVDKGTNIHANLQEVLVAGNRARDLVKQILTMSRNDPKEIMTIQIAPLVKEALKMLRSTIPTSIEVKDKISSDPLIIEVDPSQLHQVVVNLSTNAKQAMADGYGVLEVLCRCRRFRCGYPKKIPGYKAWKICQDYGQRYWTRAYQKNISIKFLSHISPPRKKEPARGLDFQWYTALSKVLTGILRFSVSPAREQRLMCICRW